MIVGIIAEGVTDQRVIRNILYSFDLEKNQIRFLRPELSRDATDGFRNMSERQFGSWTNVKDECVNKSGISSFFESIIDDQKLVIIQLDSDVCSQYGVNEVIPINDHPSIELQRNKVIAIIKEWMEHAFSEQIGYAICIRNMDAWVLSLEDFNPKKDTSFISDPKNKLKTGNRNLRSRSQAEAYELISDPFSKKKKLAKATSNNLSLKFFVDELGQLIKSKSS
ncbi:MAG TPA: hypothetical protein PKD51_12980 [Saprospiraceae bacterium]|nr:hypothetical protein [Saprospiraceae bacterium]